MFQVPVNRWTIGAAVAVLLAFGNDFIAPLMKVLAIFSAPYTPAM